MISWQEFIECYRPYIFSILSRSGIPKSLLDDNCQEILLKLWKGIRSFEYDPAKCKFRSWLSTICRYHIYNFFNKDNRRKSFDKERYTSSRVIEQKADIDFIIESEWEVFIVEKAFIKVGGYFSEKVMKVYTEFQNGVKPEDIAKHMKIALNSVYVYNKRVKDAMIREILILTEEYS